MMMNVWLPFVLGGISGVVFSLVINKNVLQKPQRIKVGDKVFYNTGMFGDFCVGALAGVAAVNLIAPEGALGQIIAISILGGFNGGVFLKKNALAKDENPEIDSEIEKILTMELDEEKFDEKTGGKR